MKVLLVRPFEKPIVTEIGNDLQAMQEAVGGYIQALYPYDDEIALVCNDEGKLLRLPPNRFLKDNEGKVYDIIAGDFFVCAAPSDSESFESLPEPLIKKYSRIFA